MTIQIRAVRLGDAQAVLDLFRQLDSETAFMLCEPGERQTTFEQQRELLVNYIGSEHRIMFVAEQGHALLGFIAATGGTANRDRHALRIAMGVLSAHWGKSIGRQLLQGVQDWASAHQFHRLELTVMEHNQRARALYQKVGFESEGMRRDALKVDGRFINEYYMAKLI